MEQWIKRIWGIINKNSISLVIFSLLPALGAGYLAGMAFFVTDILYMDNIFAEPFVVLIIGILVGMFVVYPVILSVINFVGVFVCPKDQSGRKKQITFEIITIILGSVYTLLYLGLTSIRLNAGWSEQLYNAEVHQPVWSGGVVTVIVLCCVGLLGYGILSGVRLSKMPPLLVVLSMSAMYLGVLECVLWMIQTLSFTYCLLSVFPANCVLIAVKTVRFKIREWNQMDRQRKKDDADSSLPGAISRVLAKAELWPLLALLLMWPLLGILLCILVLFGQKPDAVIRAWTETAEWNLSMQTAPPQLYYDEHYLCTVAAGGHEKIVKPIRMGERHGHRVVVNRQLCIANAFEQILEERTPKFHKKVRHFYDTYGFPIARLIRTKGAADVVYVIMKPLEWIFLSVIYLCDAKPENRIAVQYLPKRAWHV